MTSVSVSCQISNLQIQKRRQMGISITHSQLRRKNPAFNEYLLIKSCAYRLNNGNTPHYNNMCRTLYILLVDAPTMTVYPKISTPSHQRLLQITPLDSPTINHKKYLSRPGNLLPLSLIAYAMQNRPHSYKNIFQRLGYAKTVDSKAIAAICSRWAGAPPKSIRVAFQSSVM
jgi:hypothetical protein